MKLQCGNTKAQRSECFIIDIFCFSPQENPSEEDAAVVDKIMSSRTLKSEVRPPSPFHVMTLRALSIWTCSVSPRNLSASFLMRTCDVPLFPFRSLRGFTWNRKRSSLSNTKTSKTPPLFSPRTPHTAVSSLCAAYARTERQLALIPR